MGTFGNTFGNTLGTSRTDLGTVGQYIPTDFPGLKIMYDSEHVAIVDGGVNSLTDRGSLLNDAVAPAAENRPDLSLNEQNGLPAISFKGTDDKLNNAVANNAIAVPLTHYFMFRPAPTINKGYMGRISTGFYVWTVNPTYGDSGGSIVHDGHPALFSTINILVVVVNGASSFMMINGKKITGTLNQAVSAFSLGCYTNNNTTCATYKFFEHEIYSEAHDDITIERMSKYYQRKYDELGFYSFDGVFNNSVTLKTNTSAVDANHYNRRNVFSSYKFTTSATKLRVQATGSSSSVPLVSIYVYVNGAYQETLVFTAPSILSLDITLPVGKDKIIELVEGGASVYTVSYVNSGGVSLRHVFANDIITKVAPANVTTKIVGLGDSIMCGEASDNYADHSFLRLFKHENNIEVAALCAGYMTIAKFAGDASLVTATVGYITSLFANVTGVKKLLITAGLNDSLVDSLASATFLTYYGNLLDAINASDSTIQIYCMSPIDDDAVSAAQQTLLTEYRAGISTLCSSRAYTTYINGLDVIPDIDVYSTDNIHPNNNGHKLIKDTLYPIIYP